MTEIPLTIVIPVFNEAENIWQTLSAIWDNISTIHRVLCVYDFREDNTIPVVENYCSEYPNRDVGLLQNRLGSGALNAIKSGFLASESEMILVVMGDSSDDLSKVDLMIHRMKAGFDIVCGSRYIRGGHHVGGPVLKKTLSRIAGLSFHLLTGADTHDVSNSFKLYRTTLLRHTRLESDGGFELGLEILAKAWVAGKRVTEIPAVWRDRAVGKSRFKLAAWLFRYLRWYFYGLRRNRLFWLRQRN